MKQFLVLFMSIIILSCFTGCDLSSGRLDLLNSSSKSETEAMKHVEDTVIEALETKNADLLKSLFSKKALERAEDIDMGIEYMFNLYQGKFVEVTYENHSADGTYENGNNEHSISARFNIATNVSEYEISWIEWLEHDEEPDYIGVYKLQMREYKEGEYASYISIAGVNYPERDVVHNTGVVFYDVFETCNQDDFKSMFSQNSLSQPGFDENADEVMLMMEKYFYSDMGDGWVNYSNASGKARLNAYFEIDITSRKGSYIMYFCFDEVETDKLSILKFTRIEDGTDISNYNLGDEIVEPGIYIEG